MDAQGGVNQVVKTGQITDPGSMFNHLASFIYEKYLEIGLQLGLKQDYLYNELETGAFKMKKGNEKAMKMLQLWQQSVDDAHFTYSALAAALEQHGHKRAALKFCYTEAPSNLRSKPQKCVETCDTPTVNSGNNRSLAIATLYSPQPDSTDSSRRDSPRIKPHHKKLKEMEQFQCPCGNCDLITYVNKQCPRSRSCSYPYLDVNTLSDDDKEDLLQRLTDDTSNITECFSDLLSNTGKSLRRRQITHERLIEVSLDLGVYKSGRNQIPLLKEDQTKLKETTSISGAFNILRDHMSFFNYELLGYIIRHLGDENDYQKFEVFCSKFKDYCKRKVFEVPTGPAVLHPSGSERSSRKKFVVLATPDLINTLADVKAAQRKIASLLGLRASTVQLERIDIGCVILVFSIPGTLNNLFPLKASTCAELKADGYTLIVPNKPTDQALNAQPKSLKRAFSPQHLPFEPITKDRKVESSETEKMEIEIDQDIKMVPSTTTAVLVSVDDQQQKVEVMDMDEIQTTFRILVTHIKRSLKNKHVPAQEIASHAMRFGVADSDKEKLKKEESLDQLFILLKKYWSFLEYNMLESIVQTYGSDSDLSRMEQYKESLKAFCNTPLSEMPQESLLLNDDKIRDQIIAVLSITDPTFRAIMDLKIKLCTILRVEPHTLQLMEINKHSLEVKFMILDHSSRSIVSERLSESQEDSLSELSVIFLIYMCYSQHGILSNQSYTMFNINDVILSETCKSEQAQIAKVAQLINEGRANVNYQDRLGVTPLHFASTIGRADIVKFLIAKGARINTAATGGGNWTPLHCASKAGHREVAEILINAGAQVDAKLTLKEGESSCDTPLVLACSHGHKSTVELLLRKNANVNYQNALGLTPLHFASMIGRADIVEFLIAKGARVNTAATGDRNWTPLHCASREGHRDVAEILLNAGAQVDAKLTLTEDSVCDTPLVLACFYGHKTTVELLLRKNANINYQNDCGWTPLHCAISNGHTDVAKLLINAGAEVDAKLMSGKCDSALTWACKNEEVEIAQLLIAKGANLDHQNEMGFTPLHLASVKGNICIVKMLIDAGAKINIPAKDEKYINSYTALIVACLFGHTAIVDLLIKNGALVNYKDKLGYTPLHHVIIKGHLELVEVLINAGAHINIATTTESRSGTALTFACMEGHTAIVKLLIHNGALLDHQDKFGYTPLHLASGNGYLNIVELLINAGAQINIAASTEMENVTALTFACMKGHTAIVKLLIKNGAELDYQTKIGLTPLHIASNNGDVDIVEMLIVAGAQINIASTCKTNTRCGTALTLASMKGHIAIVNLLIQNGAFLDHQDNFGFTPLHLAIFNGYMDVVELLINAGAQVNIIAATTESRCVTALIFACMKGHTDTAKLLIQKGALLDYQDKLGCTPLHFASRNGDIDVVEVLVNAGAQVDIAAKTEKGHHDTPLLVACLGGHEAIVKLLINKKANVNHKNKLDFTPLHCASMNGHTRVVKLLIEHGAQNNIPSTNKVTALMLASEKGHTAVIEMLILHGSYVNHKDEHGFTALHYASLNGHFKAAEMVIDHGAQVTAATKDNSFAISPLMLASLNGHTTVAELLIDEGADVNFMNKVGSEILDHASQNGYVEVVKMVRDNGVGRQDKESEIYITALMLACLRGYEDLTKLLLCKKASINHRDKVGYTPLHHASQNGRNEIVKILTENGAKLDVPAEDNTTPLMLSCINGHAAIAEMLILKGANVDHQRKDGRTALLIASWNGKIEIVKLLLKFAAKSDIQDKDGLTCLMLAVQGGHIDIVKALLESQADSNLTDQKQWSALFFAAEQGNIEIIQMLLNFGANVDLRNKNGATAYDVAQLQEQSKVCEVLCEWSRRTDKPLSQVTQDQKTQLQIAITQHEMTFMKLKNNLEFLKAAHGPRHNQKKSHNKGYFSLILGIELQHGAFKLTNANIFSERMSEKHSDPELIYIFEDTTSQHQQLISVLLKTDFYTP